jgi:hypothetical protein
MGLVLAALYGMPRVEFATVVVVTGGEGFEPVAVDEEVGGREGGQVGEFGHGDWTGWEVVGEGVEEALGWGDRSWVHIKSSTEIEWSITVEGFDTAGLMDGLGAAGC